MNQILLTDNKNLNKNNRGNRGSSANVQKIVLFSSITVLIFAIVMVSVYAYKIHKNKEPEEKLVSKPTLSLEETEDNKDVRVIAESEVGISKIVYQWNDDTPTELNMNGLLKHEQNLEIPIGNNTLKLKVIDVNNQEIETTKTFDKLPKEKPTITVELIQSSKLKITASVANEAIIQYMAYKWDEEQETQILPENVDDTIIEKMIDAKRGNHKLTVRALDSYNNEAIYTKPFNGVNKPIIKVTRYDKVIYIKVKHDMGFEKIEFKINDKTYIYDKTFPKYDAHKTEIEYQYTLREGENKVIILAISNEVMGNETGNAQEIYKGKCNYP